MHSLYNGKKKKAIKIRKKEDVKIMVNNFINTQRNFISDIEKRYIPKEHKTVFFKKKEESLYENGKYTSN